MLGHSKFHMCFRVSHSLGEIKCGHALSFLFSFSNGSSVSAVNNRWPLFNASNSSVFDSFGMMYGKNMRFGVR